MRTYQERARKAIPQIVETIRFIESKILKTMQKKGYGKNQMLTALGFCSRYGMFGEKENEENYFASVLPPSNEIGDNALPAPMPFFSEAYQKPLQEMHAKLAREDLRILNDLQREGMTQKEAWEDFRGKSIFGMLAADERLQGEYEAATWENHVRAREKASEEEYEDTVKMFHEVSESDTSSEHTVYREGRLLRLLYSKTNCMEETVRRIVLHATKYDGENKEAYADRLSAEAWKLEGKYRALDKAPVVAEASMDEIYRSCLRQYKERLHIESFRLKDERRIYQMLSQSSLLPQEKLMELLERDSIVMHDVGRNAEKTRNAIMEPSMEEEQTYEDLFQVSNSDTLSEACEVSNSDTLGEACEVSDSDTSRERVWQGDQLEAYQENEVPRELAKNKSDTREAKKKLRTFRFVDERVLARDEKSAEEMYLLCKDEIEREIPLPFYQKMDETIICHMFSVGYTEEEIEGVVQKFSPKRMNQKDYGKSVTKYVSNAVCLQMGRSAIQNFIGTTEYKYLQNKTEQHQTLNEYEEQRVRRRSVPPS